MVVIEKRSAIDCPKGVFFSRNCISLREIPIKYISFVLPLPHLFSSLPQVVQTGPALPPGTRLEGAEAPYWSGSTVSVVCDFEFFSASATLKSTNATLTNVTWVLDDPDFFCINGKGEEWGEQGSRNRKRIRKGCLCINEISLV